MPYSAASITSGPVLTRVGRVLRVEWTSSAPAGTWFQVYVDRRLAVATRARRVTVPYPRDRVRVDVGAVAVGEGPLDFSGSLPADPAPPNRVQLAWKGDGSGAVVAFRVCASRSAGGPVDLANVLATVPATAAGVNLSGWGRASWGEGVWGKVPSSYSWRSPALPPGVWSFSVVPIDAAGNATGAPAAVSLTVASAPRAVAPDASGRRLTYSLAPSVGGGWGTGVWGGGSWGAPAGGWGSGGWGQGSWGHPATTGWPVATLHWLASPGA